MTRKLDVNVVATRATRAIARHIILESPDTGADAVLRHLRDLDPEQLVPLVALLAKAAASGELPPIALTGQPMKALRLSEEGRREAHRLYVGGRRDPETRHGEREYQRERKRAARAAKLAMGQAAETEVA